MFVINKMLQESRMLFVKYENGDLWKLHTFFSFAYSSVFCILEDTLTVRSA